MKALTLKLSLLFLVPLLLFTQIEAGSPNIDELISKMTLEEKAGLVVGMGMRIPGFATPREPVVGKTADKVPGAAGTTYAIPRLGIPSIVMADGPAGLRIAPIRQNDSTQTYYATAFPIATMLASTWDTQLIEEVGQAIGDEILEYGVDIILMPGMNLHRNPLCGRNFEYYSEDPLLSGSMAAAMIKGIQSKGVGTSIKHYVANNQETNRNTINAIVSERALRELYLKGYEIAIKEAHPWTVMSSYNKVNGIYTSENYHLLTSVLRDNWKFKGFVMTDWFGGRNPIAQMQAGNDLLMPGTKDQVEKILTAVKEKQLDEKVLDLNVKRILNIVLQTPAAKNYAYNNKPDLAAHAKIARATAAEGIVLLKNDNNVLPLKNVKKVSLFGNTSYKIFTGGTGSGDVNEAYSISLEEGLHNAGYQANDELKEIYQTYIKETEANLPIPNNPFMPKPPVPEMPAPAEKIRELAQNDDVAIITIGRNSGEFRDRKLDGDFYLNDTEKVLIEMVSGAFHNKGKKVVVVLNIGGVVETASWRDLPDAILLAWQPGQEGGNPIADILSGSINPSGKLPMTFPVVYEDVPSAKYFPGIPEDKPDSVIYKEDIFVGYRHYNTHSIKPAYEFGYGLSYTEFAYENLELSSKKFKDKITATITVTNTGNTAGKEIVQLYICAPSEKLIKPESELRSFAKTKLLKPGESQTLTFDIRAKSLTSFDEEIGKWLAEKGKYTVKIGSSSLDIKHTESFKLSKELVLDK